LNKDRGYEAGKRGQEEERERERKGVLRNDSLELGDANRRVAV